MINYMPKVMGIMWPASQSHFHLLFIFIEMNFYSSSFLCDVCNEVCCKVREEEEDNRQVREREKTKKQYDG